ncbi:MAG TPA: OsmC family protein [Bacteroidales bacterium]|nr:OsmC family protein [Bacteroidales bacterium]
MKRTSKAQWNGSLKDGKGTISTQSPVLYNTPYSFNSRFEDGMGTNPEELIAAAHAGCFSMAFSNELSKAGYTPESIETQCTITMENLTITASHLNVKANVPGIDPDTLNKIANGAKENCPVSRALNLEISMELESVTAFQSSVH